MKYQLKEKTGAKRPSLLPGVFLLALAVIFLFSYFAAGQDAMLQESKAYSYDYRNVPHNLTFGEERPLRVILPYEKRQPGAISPFGPGLDEELLARFLKENQYEVRFYYADAYDKAMHLLRYGRADLAIGFGGELSDDSGEQLAQSEAYASFYPVLLEDSYILDEHVAYRWFWATDDRELNEKLNKFWSGAEQEGFLAELRERYHSFMPRKSRKHDLRELAEVITEKMGQYNAAIMKAATETGLDPLLIAAVIFQESRFDPEARSSTGVRGIMQITTRTAEMLNVDRLDPEQCILGGARYLSEIRHSLDDLEMSEWDRLSLTLAAYNQGPSNLRKALRLAAAEGSGYSWAEMRGVYSRLAASGAGSENFRHKEALSYVENVRYYYYVMSHLAGIAGLEDKHLAPLLLLSAAS